MGFKRFDWYSGSLSLILFSLFVFFLFLFSFPYAWIIGSLYSVELSIFSFDVVSVYLIILSFLLGVSLISVLSSLSLSSRVMLLVSVMSSVLCYSCCHALWFWIFYELSILPLLLLLITESPYSERFIASWYLLGYIVFTSLPMLLCLFYISGLCGGYYMQVWSPMFSFGSGFFVFVLLSILFITKIPLPPFHVWLPIVHAEASSPVSVCLSGYIMKLGLLGVCRFSYFILSDYIFSIFYVLASLLLAILFFFSACRELDGKRWLAFLSLSHIVIASLCLCVCGYDAAPLSYLYCLGHGISAGVTFIFLWLMYDISGSRNWSILKYGLSGGLLLRCLCVSCLCTTASIPPTVNFFCETLILSEGGFVSVLIMGAMFIYLFLSGLVPIFLVGCLLSRHYSISFSSSPAISLIVCVSFLCFWAFIMFMVF